MGQAPVNQGQINVQLGEGEMQDALLGWLRDVGELPPSELAAQFDRASDQRLRDLVAHCVVGLIVPDDLTADEFAQWVRDIRRSHIEWNRALGQALLDAEDARSNGDKDAAMHLLTDFAAQCAWLPLKCIAEGEAQRFRFL